MTQLFHQQSKAFRMKFKNPLGVHGLHARLKTQSSQLVRLIMTKFPAKLLRKIQLNADVVQFDFAWEQPVPFQAGQFFMIEVSDGEKKLTRAYSISSAPSKKTSFHSA